MCKMGDAVMNFFFYVLKSLPVAAVVALVLLLSKEEFRTPDFQLNIPAQDGKHALNMQEGFTRVTIGPDGIVYVLDVVSCKIHEEEELLMRPVGY